jgi:hypothetical protein
MCTGLSGVRGAAPVWQGFSLSKRKRSVRVMSTPHAANTGSSVFFPKLLQGVKNSAIVDGSADRTACLLQSKLQQKGKKNLF